MRIGEIHKELGGLRGDIALWLICVASPVRSGLAILGSDLDDERKLARALRVWVVAFALSLGLQLPIYRAAGIAWSDVEFHAPLALYQLAVLGAGAASAHAALRLAGVRSRFAEMMVLYAVIIGAYTPVVILLNYPGMMKLVATLELVKARDPAFADILTQVAVEMTRTPPTFGDAMVLVVSPFLTFLSALVLTAYARAVARWYACPDAQVLRAFAFGTGVIFPPVVAVLWLFFGFVLYVFAGGG